ncbi:MAG: S8 family serine peptidase [bacterium]|nr:S8 family serine peptidase [bacterium]
MVSSAGIVTPATAQEVKTKKIRTLADKTGKIKQKKQANRVKKAAKQYVEGEILVKYKKSKINLETTSGNTTESSFVVSKKLQRKKTLKNSNTALLKIKDTKTVEQKVAELLNDPNVEYVGPNYIRSARDIQTDDTSRAVLWGLDNTGQTINGSYESYDGIIDADIDAPEAWAINEGTNADVIVAVIDTGVAYNHPDLIANMWDGTNCKNENGSALGGCNHGYDYNDNDKTPLPSDSTHGTHVAGTIAAVKGNAKGIIGVAPRAKIMALKFAFDIASEAQAIDFAIQNGAKVINASYGGPDFSQIEYDAINRFKAAGGIFVAAAGNDSADHAAKGGDYPADYNLDNIITVAATDPNDHLSSFSDYGAVAVDVGAPGTEIYSATMDGVDVPIATENFESVTPPSIPSGWVKGGTSNDWSTRSTSTGNALYANLSAPYANNADTTVTSPAYNLSVGVGATLKFTATCDSEYSAADATDYMELLGSSNGVDYFFIKDWDKWYLNYLNNNSENPVGPVSSNFEVPIFSFETSSNFHFRFHWKTNATDNEYSGCSVDNIALTQSTTDGGAEKYEYLSGTSMATPHVVGLVALIEGYNPALTPAQVKAAILNSGDPLPDLAGKTVSGKRINAQKALQAVTGVGPSRSISGTVKYYDGVKAIPGATITLTDSNGAVVSVVTTDANGAYQFLDIASGGNYNIQVSKVVSLAGLTSADQIKIGRHIVGQELLASVYKIIAGDVNNSGGLTSADQIKIGRFIVGLDSGFSSGIWKFYSSSIVPTINNYLIIGMTRTIANLAENLVSQDFVGIKMGDVNNSWTSN